MFHICLMCALSHFSTNLKCPLYMHIPLMFSTDPMSSVRLPQPCIALRDSRSLVEMEGHSEATVSNSGAKVSSVITHFAPDDCSRWRISRAVSWEVPGIRTVPVWGHGVTVKEKPCVERTSREKRLSSELPTHTVGRVNWDTFYNKIKNVPVILN